MDNEVEVFKNKEFGEIRTLIKDNEPWFVGKDIAKALGYKDTSYALNAHVESYDKGIGEIQTPGGMQKMILINEAGLYSLILSSKLDNAKQFKKWVTGEVLPSIRKHGAYMTEQTIEKALTNPDFLIQLATQLKEEREKRLEVEKTNQILMHHKKLYTSTEIAKELNLSSAKKLNEMLYKDKIQFKQNGTWILYSDYSDLGYVRIKQEVLDSGKIIYHRKWTQEGRKFIIEKYKDLV